MKNMTEQEWSKQIEKENEEHTKPCRVDGVTPCVQYPDEGGCGCDFCEDCEVALAYRRKNEN